VEIFTAKTESENRRQYLPELVAVYKRYSDMRFSSLARTAQEQAELITLLDYLGVPAEKTNADPTYRKGPLGICILVPEIKNPGDEEKDYVYKNPSEDTISTITINNKDGSKILIDAVFDGMGGHGSGERASFIAKDVLETAALAGWIKTAEDVRRALVLADLAITMEQISDKSDLNTLDRSNDMGTTAVVTLQKGDEFYGIHCGDSEYRLIRDGKMVFKSASHSLEYDMKKQGADIESDVAQQFLKNSRNVVVSALGAPVKYLDINNLGGFGYTPLTLQPDDVVAICSDGVNDPLCGDHEYAIVINDCEGNLEQAISIIMDLAKKRNKKKQLYQTMCECEDREGKNDDRSLILRKAKAGM